MEVKRSTLDKLVCDYCSEYLSISPVMLLEEGKSVCGRCSAPDPTEQSVLRNLVYEDLAKEILFPCQYEKHGCAEKRKFGVIKTHEAECQFKQYSCFMTEMRSCEWFGRRMDVLQHCKDKHPGQVVDNPVTFVHDISQASVQNYLMMAFEILFLIHTKVCLQTKKIYHCVRLLGDSGHIKEYSYQLEITNEKNKLIKDGEVAPQGCLAIKDSDSVAVSTNSLIDIFGGYTGTSFKLTVNSCIEETTLALKKDAPRRRPYYVDVVICCVCKKNIRAPAYYFNKNWKCSDCANNEVRCRN